MRETEERCTSQVRKRDVFRKGDALTSGRKRRAQQRRWLKDEPVGEKKGREEEGDRMVDLENVRQENSLTAAKGSHNKREDSGADKKKTAGEIR